VLAIVGAIVFGAAMLVLYLSSTLYHALPQERAKLGLVTDGDFRLLRGTVEGLVKDIHHSATVEFVPAELPWAQAGARVLVNGRVMGEAGVFSDTIREKFDFKDVTPCGAELDFDELLALGGGAVKIKPIPRFPAIERDLSLVVAEPVLWAQIERAIQEVAPAELEEMRSLAMKSGGKASIVAPICALYPVVVVFLAPILLHESITKVQGLGVLCGLIAVVLLSV
jgi:phenylalanyl-tRNA synthetase beta subunit